MLITCVQNDTFLQAIGETALPLHSSTTGTQSNGTQCIWRCCASGSRCTGGEKRAANVALRAQRSRHCRADRGPLCDGQYRVLDDGVLQPLQSHFKCGHRPHQLHLHFRHVYAHARRGPLVSVAQQSCHQRCDRPHVLVLLYRSVRRFSLRAPRAPQAHE